MSRQYERKIISREKYGRTAFALISDALEEFPNDWHVVAMAGTADAAMVILEREITYVPSKPLFGPGSWEDQRDSPVINPTYDR
jgi:hypothetical protein